MKLVNVRKALADNINTLQLLQRLGDAGLGEKLQCTTSTKPVLWSPAEYMSDPGSEPTCAHRKLSVAVVYPEGYKSSADLVMASLKCQTRGQHSRFSSGLNKR